MRIYLAADYSYNFKNDHGVKYSLTSYMDGETVCKKDLLYVGVDNFLLDSGVFTILNQKNKKINLNEYVDKYIKFINNNNVKYFFEMDLYSIIGIQETEIIRKKIARQTKRKTIPVWHKILKIDYWKKLVEEYDYIAIGGFAIKDIKKQEIPFIKKMVNYAYFNKVKVHGLGFTSLKHLNDFKFYSVDSSSWVIGGARFRRIYYFNKNKLITKIINSPKKLDGKKLVSHNCTEWIKYQNYMDKKVY